MFRGGETEALNRLDRHLERKVMASATFTGWASNHLNAHTCVIPLLLLDVPGLSDLLDVCKFFVCLAVCLLSACLSIHISVILKS